LARDGFPDQAPFPAVGFSARRAPPSISEFGIKLPSLAWLAQEASPQIAETTVDGRLSLTGSSVIAELICGKIPGPVRRINPASGA
jgi:hypothetical protein